MGFQSKEIIFFILTVFASKVAFIFSQPSAQGFISLDCGIPNNQSYTDTTTNLEYISDYDFIAAGTSYNISSSFLDPSLSNHFQTIRSFQNGLRNCYTLQPAIRGQRYLIRAGFMYGNYDRLNSKSILFDLHIGPNFWKTIEITNASVVYKAEIITSTVADFVFVCLINVGHGTPFISLLEMRPLKESIYEFANASQSLNLYTRIYMGPSIVRYPSDPYDRVWRPVDPGSHWDTISTDKTITNNNNDEFEAPSAALQFAATPANGSRQLKFNWGDGNISTEYYFVFYFSELVDLTSTNDSRIFSIYHSTSSDPLAGPFSPPYLVGFHYSANGFFTGLEYPNISIRATSSSTLPPIINAIEIYSREIPTQPMTDLTDFEAIEGIKKDHGVKKNWMGDPCSPAQYAWDGLMCSFGINSTKIIRVDLSYSKLAGVISNSFASLQSVQVLDLSHNNLIGTVPEFLGNMTSLQVLSLTDNCLGAIPDKLLQKAAAGTLTLRYEPQATSCGASDNPKKKKSTVIIVVIASVIVVAMLLLMIYIRKRRPTATSQDAMISWEIDQTIRFTKSQLEKIIKTFNKRIGAGGFGEVFYGKLENDTEVAIKVLSKTSSQGYKEFKKEVEALPAIYHGNIVKFIGYCEEGEYLALVYEYMPNRSLADQLHEESSLPSVLSWERKLKIAHGAAQGLEYLHTGRQMVHRDVKSANILLDQNFEAKVSDFGMSRIFDENTVTMTQSTIGGTFGYLDPEILTGATKKLSFPSDVYSFGVVLLEIVTGQPPFSQERGSLHIVDYVSQNPTIFDPKMGEYDPESVRKVINLAMQCTKRTSKDRPTMSHVVLELQQCLDMGTSHQWSMSQYSGASSTISKTIPF